MLIWVVHLKVRPELTGEFARAIVENARRSVEREPGCVRFEASQKEDDPTEWLMYEVYTDSASQQAHRHMPHFNEYMQVAERAIISRTATAYVSRARVPDDGLI